MNEGLPIRLSVWSKSYSPLGFIGAPVELSCDIRMNAAGEASFVLPADHAAINDLTTQGARVVIEYRPSPSAAYQTIFSGPVGPVEGQGEAGVSQRTFTVIDDWSDVFNGVLCWPNPTGAITAQGDETVWFTKSGAAETVAKQILAPNASRDGISLTIPTTGGLGSSITVATRMHTAAEKLFPVVDQAGVILRVLQQGSARTLLASTPTVYPMPLTEQSGVIIDHHFTTSPATVTRVMVATGGADSTTQRAFKTYINTALEAAIGRVLWAFLEVSADSTNLTAAMDQEAAQVLADGAPKVSVAAELQETEFFRFGVAFQLGDRIPIQLANAPLLTDFVREVQFSWTVDDGLSVVPLVGNWQDETANPDLVRAVASMSKQFRNTQRSR